MGSIKIELDRLTNSCFVIMPFSATFNAEYENVIRPAVEEAGLVSVRADEIYSRPQVTQDIWKALRASRIVIAELTGKNTNVFYEVGLAHTLGKPVIIITRNEDDVPFDLKALRYRYYNVEDPFWGENLKQAIKNMIVELQKETNYGYVFEGISLEGVVKYEPVRSKELGALPQKRAYDIAGIWQGIMDIAGTEYSCSLYLTQAAQELSGTMIVSFVYGEGRLNKHTVVQEMMIGGIKNRDVNVYAISYSFIEQGALRSYTLDILRGELSADGDEISGKASDGKNEFVGAFCFKRVKAERKP